MTQKEALHILKLGHNVYITGQAGSGKTYLLNAYIKYLREEGVGVGITASTGIAATHLGGMTIHAWAGIGIADDLSTPEIKALLKKPYLRQRFAATSVLIIDEVSMLHAHRLDLVDKVCKAFKKSQEPFGGLQVVLCGDFFQLPPVNKTNNTVDQDFIYNANIWYEMDVRICYLAEQHRQFDKRFTQILNDVRSNSISKTTMAALEERYQQPVKGTVPTKLYTHNIDVDGVNAQALTKLDGEQVEYPMKSSGNESLLGALKKSCLAPEKLYLKVDAQVMFVKNNYEKGFVNGTLGKVLSFTDDYQPVIETLDGRHIVATQASWVIEEDGVIKAEIKQLPLRLAWAITVHKSQGMSLDAAEIDLSKSFVPGMGYVALSRVRSLAGIKLMGLNQTALEVNPKVLELDLNLLKLSRDSQATLKALAVGERKKLQEDFVRARKG